MHERWFEWKGYNHLELKGGNKKVTINSSVAIIKRETIKTWIWKMNLISSRKRYFCKLGTRNFKVEIESNIRREYKIDKGLRN